MLRKYFVFLILFFGFFLFPGKIFALDNFYTDYTVSYTVKEDGVTHANLNVVLTNKTTQYYASSYKVEVGFENITNVKASDEKGAIIPVIEKSEKGQAIEVSFNDKIVGLNKKLHFSLSFDTKDIANHSGKVWEINIPGIANQKDFDTFNVSLKVPPSLGTPNYIKPTQSNNKLTFTKDQLGQSGISIGFGKQQQYAFRLVYHLRNTNVFPIRTEIALPPTTNYQDIYLHKIDPKPQQVLIDEDGNWMAQYYLLPSQNLDVIAEGYSFLSLEPKTEEITEKQKRLYTQEQPYWRQTSKIRTLAKELQTPEAIYEYVVNTLHYDFSRVTANQTRLGADKVLSDPSSAVCLEFTDLFIALARAAGIPARQINGFAYTQNVKERPLSLISDILHAWPEYYDFEKKTWVMVDPTWGNTTSGVDYFHVLDYDHFAFVINGKNSEYPVPAGGYKGKGDEMKKDVEVTFTDDVVNDSEDLEIDSNIDKVFTAGVPLKNTFIIKNIGEGVIRPRDIELTANILLPQKQTLKMDAIPPFGYATIPFSLRSESFLTNDFDQITIHIADKKVSQKVHILPFFIIHQKIIGGVTFVIFTIIISFIAVKARRLSVSRRKK